MHQIDELFIGTEATSFYDFHLLEYLATCHPLKPFGPKTYRINPKLIKRFKKSDNTDESAAFFIADFLRFGRLPHPFEAHANYLPLQRCVRFFLPPAGLTRFRAHLTQQIAAEKNYFLSHLFLKFSAFTKIKPFADTFGATSQAVISEFFSVDEIANTDIETWVEFICSKGKNRFGDPKAIVEKIKTVAKESYRIRPALAKSVSIVLATSWQNIRVLTRSVKAIDKAIENAFAAFPNTLQSVPGIGPVYAAGIFAEIGDIHRFASDAQIAKFAGLVWHRNQSGEFEAEQRRLAKSANMHLRYYLVEAANCCRIHNDQYRAYYPKKYKEVTKHQHKRAWVLTARKRVRLVYALLTKNPLYQPG
ncbi:IS110 family transposase [Candidatus Poribacteria bacterium]|nr:IS110 family transposase [Candidatus Poribacteria bacterium]